jgi:hypothetical protein
MRYREHAKVLKGLETGEANFRLLRDIDRRAAKRGELLWRYIAEPRGDGQAYYQIVRVSKRRVQVEVCRNLGDDWVVPYWGDRASIDIGYARRSIERRDRLAEIFGKTRSMT